MSKALDSDKHMESYLTVRAIDPRYNVSLKVPESVLDLVLGPADPLYLSEQQREDWIKYGECEFGLAEAQIEQLKKLINGTWAAGEFDAEVSEDW